MKDPKIFGAGLLSSVGEARWCLSDKVKKLPLTIDCVEMGYDITEPQPQLFVTSSFKHLEKVLEDFAQTMSYKRGGILGLERAKKAATVNTVQYNTGIQVSGKLKNYLMDSQGVISYLQFDGPTQLSYREKEIEGHDKKYHVHGFGSPVGFLTIFPEKCISSFSNTDWEKFGVKWNSTVENLTPQKLPQPISIKWKWTSGLQLVGNLVSRLSANGRTILLTFTDCKVTLGEEILFDPSWGTYDMAVGSSIPTVFGGAADRESYGESSDFKVARVPQPTYSADQLRLHKLYQSVRDIRANNKGEQALLEKILEEVSTQFPKDWLLTLEIHEIALKSKMGHLMQKTQDILKKLIDQNPTLKIVIEEGLALAAQ